jgi:hypothetical protein
LSAGLQAALGLSLSKGAGGPSKDNAFFNVGDLNMLDKPETVEGETGKLGVRGQRREAGEEVYIEVRGPSGVGSRSSTPYSNVLPKYRKQAEESLNKRQIPKEHQKRVRDYFDSLERGR